MLKIKTWLENIIKPSAVKHFHLDYPNEKNGIKYYNEGFLIQGWVLFPPLLYAKLKSRPFLTLKINESLERLIPLDRNRPDVVQTYFPKASAERHPQIQCGFRFVLPLTSTLFPLYVCLDDQRELVAQILVPTTDNDVSEYKSSKPKVLFGSEGWLFLDNDTNFSVDQHCGRLALSASGLQSWDKYIHHWQQVFQPWGRSAIFLIAPTKESILSQYHPYPEATKSFLNSLIEKMPPEMYLYPVNELKSLGEKAYYKTDTHWTHQGAKQATLQLAHRLMLDQQQVGSLFQLDEYRSRQHIGDLGNKLNPPQSHAADFLIGQSYKKWVVFDNALPNFGRVIAMEYEQAMVDKICLVFGSSSSYSMFSYLSRLFSKVVFVHSAGSIDLDFLKAINPDYLVAQTNARFMVKAPHFQFNVKKEAREKLKVLTMQQSKQLTVIQGETPLAVRLRTYLTA